MSEPVPLAPVLTDRAPDDHRVDETAVPLLRLRVVRPGTATTLVDVRGELDLTTRAAFSDALSGAVATSPGQRVIVDLTRCAFFAACGTEVLRRAHDAARRRRGSLHVVVGADGPCATTIARTVALGAGLRTEPSPSRVEEP